ncbi:hypothetical protein DBR11_23855 [Pedobacter sp. HMWF019]|nr:hypothetical protein DBR11_23855 [Pedobacter sp. HMWF019]
MVFGPFKTPLVVKTLLANPGPILVGAPPKPNALTRLGAHPPILVASVDKLTNAPNGAAAPPTLKESAEAPSLFTYELNCIPCSFLKFSNDLLTLFEAERSPLASALLTVVGSLVIVDVLSPSTVVRFGTETTKVIHNNYSFNQMKFLLP